jgi:phosphate transport system substrate-binding protein
MIPRLLFAVGLALALPLGAWAQSIKVDGSSTVYPISKSVAEEFQKARKGAASIIVGMSGTGGGFKKFCRGEIDVAGASRPILGSEIENCKRSGVEFIELPIAYDAVTVIVNPRNTFVKSVSVDELRTLWEPAAQGNIVKWKQINPGWPDTPIKLLGPGPESGTWDYFTQAVVGKAKSSRGDYMVSEDHSIVVKGVARDANALGFVGYGYYAGDIGKLKAVAIAEKAGGAAVDPTPENIQRGAYPRLTRPLFIYVSTKSLDKPGVREFVEFYLSQGAKLSKAAKYVPLPDAAYRTGLERLKARKSGTAFGGSMAVGMSIDELMKREVRP